MYLEGKTDVSVTAHTNNWNPSVDTADVVRVTCSGTWNITGIESKYRGRVLTLSVLSGIVVLKNNDTGSSVGNRFALSSDMYLGAGSMIMLWYDLALTVWRAISVKPSMTAVSQLLGSSSASFGEAVPITLGAGLTMSGTTLSASSGLVYSTQGSNFSAAVNNGYFITANCTATLPSSATRGDKIAFYVRDGVTAFTVGRNTRDIQNVAEDMTVDMAPISFTLVFDDTTNGWWLE